MFEVQINLSAWRTRLWRVARHFAGLFLWRGRAGAHEHTFIAIVALMTWAVLGTAWVGPRAGFWCVALAAGYLAAGSLTRRFHDIGRDGAVISVALLAVIAFFFWCLWGSPETPALRTLAHWGRIAGIYGLLWVAIAAVVLMVVYTHAGPNRFGEVPPFVGWRDIFDPNALSITDRDNLRRRIRNGRRTALRLTPAYKSTLTKLGGLPLVGDDFEWPRSGGGKPLTFLAQLGLDEIRACRGPDWLPATGILCLFATPGGVDGPASWRVVYQLEPPADRLGAGPAGAVLGERALVMRAVPAYPSLNWLGAGEDLGSDGAEEVYRGFGEPSAGHRIGGYPAEMQDEPMALSCELGLAGDVRDPYQAYPERKQRERANLSARRKWRLLIQLESDPTLGMHWGDGGRLWFFVREADARRADFSKVWALSQSG